MSELKPCPFCGGEGQVIDTGDYNWVTCNDCGSEIGGVGTKEEAANIWNNRPDLHDYAGEMLVLLKRNRKGLYNLIDQQLIPFSHCYDVDEEIKKIDELINKIEGE